MNGMAQVIGCLLMYGIGKNSGLSLAPWRTLFLVCGGLTCAAGFMFYFLMPNGPNDAWFLNAREKETLSLRMARDREGGDKTAFSVRQLKESLLDIKVWFVFAFGVLVTMQSPVLTVSLRSAELPRLRRHLLTTRYKVRLACHSIHRIRQVRDHALRCTLRCGASRLSLAWCRRLLGFPSEPLPRHHGSDYPAIDRKCASAEADGRCWLGYDCFCMACKCRALCCFREEKLTTQGIMHHRRHVTPPFPYSLQLQRQHEARNRQRNVLHRVLRRLHCFSSAVDRAATLLQRSRDCYRNVVSIVPYYDRVPLCMYARQRCQGSCCKPSRSHRRVDCQSGGGSPSR